MAEYQVNDKSIIPGAPVFHFFKTEKNRHDKYNKPKPTQ